MPELNSSVRRSKFTLADDANNNSPRMPKLSQFTVPMTENPCINFFIKREKI